MLNKKMKIIFMVLFSTFVICSSTFANNIEIQHLLAFVKNTPCTYIRNGSEHTGQEAVKHIQRKYDYFKDDIKTTEDFIRLSATQSTMSGKAYEVICDGKTQTSAQWLLDELNHFRQRVAKPQ